MGKFTDPFRKIATSGAVAIVQKGSRNLAKSGYWAVSNPGSL